LYRVFHVHPKKSLDNSVLYTVVFYYTLINVFNLLEAKIMPFQKGNQFGKRKREFPFTKKDIEQSFAQVKRIIETSPDLSDGDRVKAAHKLLEFMANYFYGKPAQSLDVTSGEKPLAAVVNISLAKEDK
jgi:hypothetical protein